ncbi:hypothetical protein Y1Q_0023788 [Alligator mississippiensis]|uniref:Uncharacterized protein n=1 Tax=Alligator mississippiensis TaxID=8496 RepID=A0A151MK69_ALLMI|nr:hypothetical protein Y1Q_0023788 [Alligator mississippiensis]
MISSMGTTKLKAAEHPTQNHVQKKIKEQQDSFEKHNGFFRSKQDEKGNFPNIFFSWLCCRQLLKPFEALTIEMFQSPTRRNPK